jgi:hypothetical protein
VSLHRHAAKRDKAEPAIIKTLEAHGCLVWPLSGKGIPDLLVFYRKRMDAKGAFNQRHTFVADVKGPKEKATPAQAEKWTALTNLGFSVFILRTPEDAVAMLNNALQPWEPEAMAHPIQRRGQRKIVSAQKLEDTRHSRPSGLRYTPPREMVDGRPYFNGTVTRAQRDAAKEAEATFAPGVCCDTFRLLGRHHWSCMAPR